MIARDSTNTDILSKTKRKTVAILPIGSTEQHGPHLPVSTDSDIVTHIAKEVAKRNGFVVLPTLEYGVSFEHHPFFNLSITSATLRKMVKEICSSLTNNHIDTIIILNGHHGNLGALQNFSTKMTKSARKPKIMVYSYWHFMKRKFDHAGFVETSLMLAITDKVLMKKAVLGFVPDNLTSRELSIINRKANKSFISVTKNGVWGDPRKASAKDGRVILNEIIANIVRESQTCLTEKSRKLHQ